MSVEQRNFPRFYLTPPGPCPYLPGRHERKIFTHLTGTDANNLNDRLTRGGFRRSQNIAYKPACETCAACVSVRVRVAEFLPGRSFRRILARNRDLESSVGPARATPELHSLFRDYIDRRHAEGGMTAMTALDFAAMVEDSFVETLIVEYRRKIAPSPARPHRREDALVGAALCDVLRDGLSMIYSFFDPELAARSLGTYMVLDHIERARKRGLPYLYLGYWVRGSEKMDYKSRFRPQERLGENGWA